VDRPCIGGGLAHGVDQIRRTGAVAAIEVFLATGPEDPGEVKDRPGSAYQPLQRNRILQRSLDELGVDPRDPTGGFEIANQDARMETSRAQGVDQV